ncbi:MAG: hypothetical protein ACMXYG_07150 [Candidatus Woesearchaeota archaeon]
MKSINKKAQGEIVGITIVMVLIMLGIIFVIRFVVLPDRYDIKQAYDMTQTASNFMDSAMKTTTNCNKLTVTELIQDCAENYGTSFLYNCPPDPLVCATGCDSCNYLNNTLQVILDSSLNLMPQVNYDFFICQWSAASGRCLNSEPSHMISYFPTNQCDNATRWQRGFEARRLVIPTNNGNRVVQMYIC